MLITAGVVSMSAARVEDTQSSPLLSSPPDISDQQIMRRIAEIFTEMRTYLILIMMTVFTRQPLHIILNI